MDFFDFLFGKKKDEDGELQSSSAANSKSES